MLFAVNLETDLFSSGLISLRRLSEITPILGTGLRVSKPSNTDTELINQPRVAPPVALDGCFMRRSPTRVALFTLRWTFTLLYFCSALFSITGSVQNHVKIHSKEFSPMKTGKRDRERFSSI
jgi:hypothetical protein